MLASNTKYKFKEERKRILKMSVKKLRSIEDPEAFLSRSVLINNTLKRLQTEVREEKSKKIQDPDDANPEQSDKYSFFHHRGQDQLVDKLDNNANGIQSQSSCNTSYISQGQLDSDQVMSEAPDSGSSSASSASEADSDSESDSNSSSSSEDDIQTEVNLTVTSTSSLMTSEAIEDDPEDDLLSEVYTPQMPPPIASLDEDDLPLPLRGQAPRPSTPVPWGASSEAKCEAANVIKSSQPCDNPEDVWSEAVRTECWTKPSQVLATSSTVNTWPPNLEWPTYTPSTASTASNTASDSFSPNISAVSNCNVVGSSSSSTGHSKENLFAQAASSAAASMASNSAEKCYSCGQSSLFQSELQSVVFNSLVASLET